jgi:hypothetical protein
MFKKSDFVFFLLLIGVFLPFIFSQTIFNFYEQFNSEHGLITSFIKFAILATIGESLGLRIKTGLYNHKAFGLLPRAIVWGFLGMTIYMAFIIFSTGTPLFLQKIGLVSNLEFENIWSKLLIAFTISTTMNLIYAPVMMTIHKITDTHIINNGGSLTALSKKINVREILKNLNWDVQWNFVFKKTIPYFWIPAHTITFLLPSEYRVLFAAILGILLGVLLSVAANWNKKVLQ